MDHGDEGLEAFRGHSLGELWAEDSDGPQGLEVLLAMSADSSSGVDTMTIVPVGRGTTTAKSMDNRPLTKKTLFNQFKLTLRR